jgi:hypothetical protein
MGAEGPHFRAPDVIGRQNGSVAVGHLGLRLSPKRHGEHNSHARELRRLDGRSSRAIRSPSWLPACYWLAMLALIRLARPKHWIKNAFVVAPLFFTPGALNAANLQAVALAFAAFCLAASAIYVVNDWFDRAADRLHPEKRHRPIASGAVTVGAALSFAILLAAASVVAALMLPALFQKLLVFYVALNLGYSAWLKHVSLLDVLIVGTQRLVTPWTRTRVDA